MSRTQGDGAATAPMSDSQRTVWIAQRLDPSSPSYHECAAWRIDGPLDVAALEAALVAVAVRQPMLRTRFPRDADGTPHQHVDAAPRIALERVALPDEGALDAAMGDLARRPFDLAAHTPMRWALFELAPRRHVFMRVWHHILGDARSAQVLNDDVANAYALARSGRPAELAPLATDYLAFTRRQADPEVRASLDAHVAGWKARLAGAPTLALPTDFPRRATRTMDGAILTTRIDARAVDAMKAVAREARTSAFVMFLTAYAALLSRLSGDPDVVVGMAVTGRPGAEYSDVVGFFAAMTACRIDLGDGVVSVDAAARAHGRVREVIERYAVPLDRLVDALGVARDPSRNPFFQVAFGMRREDLLDLTLEGVDVHRVPYGVGHARFDLTLNLVDGPGGIEALWNYSTELFEAATIERMARQFAALCEAIGREPHRPIAALPLMDEAARAQTVVQACGASTPTGGEGTVHRRFVARARQRPQARAIGTLSYGELDAASSRLAAELRLRGAGPGRFVAVARERPADIAVAWLAVLKAGAAYVPVDPTLPDARIGHMLDDAHVALAVADDALAARLARDGIDVVRPDAEAGRIAAHPPVAPDEATGDDDAAYAIYTSGSTGRPKGVVVPHRAIVGLVCGADYAPLGPDDVVAQLAPPAFDASTFEFWGPLLNGASIAPIAKATALAPRQLAATIARDGITTMFVTTALFDSVARDAPGAFAPCRTVLFGGEAANPQRVAEVLRAGPPRRLVHVYGPTETTTFATFHEVREVGELAMSVPIGKAIAHAEAFVLREDGEPCAPGEPGEIVIGGSGVALGYLGGTDDDAKRFVVAPVGGLAPRPLYRTGDRARLREDGAIEYLGRLDGQVKVLGHRIELGEIEAAIARQPGVRDVAAVLRGETSDTRRIVAYVVPSNPSAPPPDGLRRALRSALPAPMMPAEIAWLPALPLNASGKVDRRALPDVVAKHADHKIHVGPRDWLEINLVGLWERILGRTNLGVYDRFFDNGGNSLLAARMVDALERIVGIAVPLTVLFVDDTIAGVAQSIREDTLAAHSDIVLLNAAGTRPPLVYVHGDFFAGGFQIHTLARLLGPDQPFYAVHPHGVAGGGVPETIEAMAAERVQALRALRPHGPYVLGGHCNGAFIAFAMARLLIEQGEPVPALIVVDAFVPGSKTGAPFDATRVAARFVEVGLTPPGDRVSDLAQRLHRAMRAYRAQRIDTHLVVVRSAISKVAEYDDQWAALGATAEVRVLPGDHVTLVFEEGGQRFSTVLRDVIDRVAAPGAESRAPVPAQR